MRLSIVCGSFALGLAGLAAFLIMPAPAMSQSAGQWERPEQIWAGTCHYCHETGIAPQLFGRNLNPATIKYFVRNGFGAMPAFPASQISEQELADLAAWVSAQPAPQVNSPTAAQSGGAGQ